MASEKYKHPIPITEQEWPADAIPMVSISCTTYNQESYIREAIEGFLMQKTTFPVEILIHDDASTDSTADIVKEYELEYPQLIKPIYQTENQYSKRDGSIGKIQRGRARGKYYATCEGDDYWIDSLKLQKQLDFMEHNLQFNIIGHLTKEISEIGNKEFKFINPKTGYLNFKEVIKLGYPMHTSSFFMRKNEFLKIFENNLPFNHGDRFILYNLTMNQGTYIFDEYMSVYRHNSIGVTKIGGKPAKDLFKKSVYNLYVPLIKKADFNLKLFLKRNSVKIYVKRIHQYWREGRLSINYLFSSTIQLFKLILK